MKPRMYGLVLDKENAKKLHEEGELKDGWDLGFQSLLALPEQRYAVIWTDSLERLKKRAPMIVLAADLSHLEMGVRAACASLDDVECQWIILADQEAVALVKRLLFSDCIPKGSA